MVVAPGRSRPRALLPALLLGVGLLGAALVGGDLLQRWERDVFDLLSRSAAAGTPPSADISLILIDEASLAWGQRLFERRDGQAALGAELLWPWQRSVYDLFIAFLAEGGADVFAFDVLLAAPHPCGDEAGEATLGASSALQNETGAPFVIHAFDLVLAPDPAPAPALAPGPAPAPAPAPAPDALVRACLAGSALEVAGWRESGLPFGRSDTGAYAQPILPERAILAAFAGQEQRLRLGAVTAQPDEDAVIRRARLLVAWDGVCQPSLGLAAALARLEARHGRDALGLSLADAELVVSAPDGERRLPLTPSGDLLLRWRDRGPHAPHGGRFPSYPAHRVLRSAMRHFGLRGWELPAQDEGYFLQPADFAGQIVFLGSNAAGLLDLQATPMAENHPGVAVHASVAEAVLEGRGMRRVSRATAAAVAAGLAMLAVLAVLRRGGQMMRLSLVAALAGLVLLGSGVLFVASGVWMDSVGPLAGILLAYSCATTANHFTEGRRSRAIAGLFEHFAPPDVVQQLIEEPGQAVLQGETRDISVFFSDIRGFTSLSNSPVMRAEPGRLTRHLNAYLTEMTAAIHACGGTVDKYIGDAVVALFGAPLPLENHAAAACRAALLCQERLSAFNARAVAAGEPEFVTRIGLFSGPATLGCVGSEHRLSYTAIGSTVNFAARLEGVNKSYDTLVLAGQPTLQRAEPGAVLSRLIDRVRVPGLSDADPGLEVHELLALPGSPGSAEAAERAAGFARARALYEARSFEAAAAAFAALEAARPDGPARVFKERCLTYARRPPPADWDGCQRLEGK